MRRLDIDLRDLNRNISISTSCKGTKQTNKFLFWVNIFDTFSVSCSADFFLRWSRCVYSLYTSRSIYKCICILVFVLLCVHVCERHKWRISNENPETERKENAEKKMSERFSCFAYYLVYEWLNMLQPN